MKKLLILITALFIIKLIFFVDGRTNYPPGIMTREIPVQKEITEKTSFTYRSFQIHPMASFRVFGKVLSRKNYYFGESAKLCPVDFAVGWGSMSDEEVLKHVEISQSNRWYYWSADRFIIPRREIERSSGNMHLIPSDKAVKRIINKVQVGDFIRIEGLLVTADMSDGRKWISSLSRVDTGADSCELIWVENIQIVDMSTHIEAIN